MVLYEFEPKSGADFRNTEFFRFDGSEIQEVAVYFGSSKGTVGERQFLSAADLRMTLLEGARVDPARDSSGKQPNFGDLPCCRSTEREGE